MGYKQSLHSQDFTLKKMEEKLGEIVEETLSESLNRFKYLYPKLKKVEKKPEINHGIEEGIIWKKRQRVPCVLKKKKKKKQDESCFVEKTNIIINPLNLICVSNVDGLQTPIYR